MSVYQGAYAESGCATGGHALAGAFVRVNPLYARFLGRLEEHVAKHRDHFRAGNDSVRCAAALSQAFLESAIQLYDPSDLLRRDQLNAQLGAIGIAPGPQQPSLSEQLMSMSFQLSRLARALPAAARGDYGPLYTATNDFEQIQVFAAQMVHAFLQDPSMASMVDQMEPILREAATLDHRIISHAAARLAGGQ
jgi:hypothetical protein